MTEAHTEPVSDVLSEEDFRREVLRVALAYTRGAWDMDRVARHDSALRAERDRFETLLNESQDLLVTAQEENERLVQRQRFFAAYPTFVAQSERAERAEARAERAEGALERVTAALREIASLPNFRHSAPEGQRYTSLDEARGLARDVLAALPPGAKQSEGMAE